MFNSKLMLSLSGPLLIVLTTGMTFIHRTVEMSILKRQVFRSQISQGTHV